MLESTWRNCWNKNCESYLFLIWLSRVKKQYPKVVVFLPTSSFTIFPILSFSFPSLHATTSLLELLEQSLFNLCFKMGLADKFVDSSQKCTEQLLMLCGLVKICMLLPSEWLLTTNASYILHSTGCITW